MARRAIPILAGLLLPCAVGAQLARSLPSGVHLYRVYGTYQGMAMAPWNSELELRDTTIGGDPAYTLVHFTPRPETNGTFTYVVSWKKSGPPSMTVRYVNRGREPNDCALSLAGGTITGSLVPAETPKPVEIKGDAFPDYAAATMLALRTLSDGDTIRFTAFRCLPQFHEAAIVTRPFVGVVRSAEAARVADGKPEPVWVIEGTPEYHMVVKLAKSDRQLVSFTIPEGTVGEQTLTYAATKKR